MLTKYRAHRVAELDALLLFQDQSEWQKTTFLPTKFLQSGFTCRWTVRWEGIVLILFRNSEFWAGLKVTSSRRQGRACFNISKAKSVWWVLTTGGLAVYCSNWVCCWEVYWNLYSPYRKLNKMRAKCSRTISVHIGLDRLCGKDEICYRYNRSSSKSFQIYRRSTGLLFLYFSYVI